LRREALNDRHCGSSGNDQIRVYRDFFEAASCSENRCFPNAKHLPAKGLCLRHYRRRALEGISEQASMTVDIGKFSILAMFRQLIPSAPPVAALNRRKRLAESRFCAEPPRGLQISASSSLSMSA
jgi:hypothetical protein